MNGNITFIALKDSDFPVNKIIENFICEKKLSNYTTHNFIKQEERIFQNVDIWKTKDLHVLGLKSWFEGNFSARILNDWGKGCTYDMHSNGIII